MNFGKNPRVLISSFTVEINLKITDFRTHLFKGEDLKEKDIERAIQLCLTFFESDSFDSRLFQYENDLPGVLTNRALFGRGNRWYLLVKYQPLKKFAAYLKYSETYRDDVDVIGTGAD